MDHKYKAGPNGSYLHNCMVVMAKRDRKEKRDLFHMDSNRNVSCRLNGYAIIPYEEYVVLKKMIEVNTFDLALKIQQANRDLEETYE